MEANTLALQPQDVQSLITEHLERYPESKPVDFYRLAYHAIIGPDTLGLTEIEQAAPVEELLRLRLLEQAKAEELAPHPWEEPVEILFESKELARVHIRPYLRSGGSLERLAKADALTRYKMQEHRDNVALAQTLGLVRAALMDSEAVQNGPALWRQKLDVLLRDSISEGLPPKAHSETYLDIYKPMYRVILLETMV